MEGIQDGVSCAIRFTPHHLIVSHPSITLLILRGGLNQHKLIIIAVKYHRSSFTTTTECFQGTKEEDIVKDVEEEEENVDDEPAEQEAVDKDEFKSIEEKIREQALKRVMAKDAERKKKEMGGLIVE